MKMALSSLSIVTITVILVSTLGQPVQDVEKSTSFAYEHDTEKESLENSLSSKFRSFFDKLSNMFTQSNDPISESRDKRDAVEEIPEFEVNSTTSNETSFEYYEKQYFINKTLAILEQYIGYFHYLEHLRDNNSSAPGSGRMMPSGNSTAEPARPSALPQGGEWTTDKGRTDPILEAQLRGLSDLSMEDLMMVFRNVEERQKGNIADPSIASVCCHFG